MAYILYKLVFASGKSYIGQTVRTMHKRLAQHKAETAKGSPLAVHCAWRKHGEPVVLVLAEYQTHDELHAAEIAAIAEHGTLTPNGYNVALGGETSPALRPEVAAKIGLKSLGRVTRETAELSETAKRQWQDPEYRDKNAAAVRDAWKSPELRQAASERSKAMWEKRKASGWSMPRETREKLAAVIVSDETRQKMAVAATGRKRGPRSEEVKAKLREASRRSWQDPELSARRVAAIKAALKKEI
jgi:hypothetical protein